MCNIWVSRVLLPNFFVKHCSCCGQNFRFWRAGKEMGLMRDRYLCLNCASTKARTEKYCGIMPHNFDHSIIKKNSKVNYCDYYIVDVGDFEPKEMEKFLAGDPEFLELLKKRGAKRRIFWPW